MSTSELDSTTLIEISYAHEYGSGYRGAGRPRARASARHLPAAHRTRTGRLTRGAHCRSGGSGTFVADVPSPKFAASRPDRSAPRKPAALLLGRLHRDECAGRLFDRELLCRERLGKRPHLRSGAPREISYTLGQSRFY